jgi:hypothetical protein
MNGHEDLELIAAFREGLLDLADSDRVARHLSGCGECARWLTALGEVAAALAQAAPPPLPPRLARRLDAALAAEAAAAGASGGAAAGTRSGRSEQGTGRTLPAGRSRAPSAHARSGHAGRAPAGHASGASRPGRRDRRGGRLWALAAAASVCLLAAGGYLLASSLTHTPSSRTSASSGQAGRQLPGNTMRPGTSSRAAVPNPNVRAPQGGTGTGALVIVNSRTNYESGQLRAQAAHVADTTSISSPGGKAGSTTVQPSGISSALAGCLQQVAGGLHGLIVDMARYDGRPATVIIAPSLGGRAGHVWVVSPPCSASPPHVIAETSY